MIWKKSFRDLKKIKDHEMIFSKSFDRDSDFIFFQMIFSKSKS